MRQDKGSLWENFLISERLKSHNYSHNLSRSYFWRTTQQQEIDYIETIHDTIRAFEFKWNAKAKVKIPKTFENIYKTKVHVIDRTNFNGFLNPTTNEF